MERLPERKKGRFVNPHVEEIRRTFRDFLLWKFGYYKEDHSLNPIPQNFSYPKRELPFDSLKPSVVWINHSSFLVSIGDRHLLTDPIWSYRCSPLPFIGPKRRHLPGLNFDELPKIDFVLISHDHYDHMDKATIFKLFERFPEILWIVPTGVKTWFIREGISKVVELSWWEELNLASTFKLTAVPTQHFSGRKPHGVNKTLWSGYVIEDLIHSKRFYFVGDTGYNSHDFKKIGEKFGPFDLSLIPIGSYSPRIFMAPVHLNPQDAVQIHEDVHSRFSIAMHWKTFHLSDEPMNQPPYDLFLALQKRAIDPQKFLAVEPGTKLNW